MGRARNPVEVLAKVGTGPLRRIRVHRARKPPAPGQVIRFRAAGEAAALRRDRLERGRVLSVSRLGVTGDVYYIDRR